MFFLDVSRAKPMLEGQGFDEEYISRIGSAKDPVVGSLRLYIENERHRSFALSKALIRWLGSYPVCFMWVREYGIWPSSENLHLYYKIRTGYGDSRPISQAPVHQFLGFESADAVTFLDIAIRSGWGAALLVGANYPHVYVSHDGWLRIVPFSKREEVISEAEQLSLTCQIE